MIICFNINSYSLVAFLHDVVSMLNCLEFIYNKTRPPSCSYSVPEIIEFLHQSTILVDIFLPLFSRLNCKRA